MSNMIRQIMALFDEYQSKENAKHTLRAMKENARQGFWNGALPPIGYRIVAAEQRGSKTKKKLEIDPLHADTVRLIYRLFLEGDGASGLELLDDGRIVGRNEVAQDFRAAIERLVFDGDDILDGDGHTQEGALRVSLT